MSEPRERLIHAAAFLTRLPLPPVPWTEDSLGRAAGWFGVVGLVVGSLTAAVWLVACGLGLPPWPAAALSLAAQLWLTGALHEDGLADLADGLGGGTTRERALQIMRDSRIGAFGAAALALSLMLRAGALAALAPWAGAGALLLAHAAGRGAMVASLVLLPYARAEGLAAGAATARGGATVALALAPAVALAVVFDWRAAAVALLLGAAAWAALSWRLVRRLGGYTGDGLGATEQVVEIAVLLALAAAWS